jgi:murein DD-endopeptidase MepM/ murein hydrolase activator NlpD
MAIQDKLDSAFTDKILKKTLLSSNALKTQNLEVSVVNDNVPELTKSNLITISNSFTSLQNAFNKIYAHTLNVRNLHQYEEKKLSNIKRENNLENKITPGASPVLNTGGAGSSLASTATTLDELASSVEKLNDKMKKINLSGNGYSNAMLLGDIVGSRMGRLGGRALGVAGIGLDAFGRYQEDQSAGQIATGVGGGLAGAALGAKGGAVAGAAIGAAFGGVGAVPGAAIGGFIGGIGGYFAGSYAGDTAYNVLNTRATGGGVKAGGTYVVGERGPEVLMLGGLSGKVIANGQRGNTPRSEKYLTEAADKSARAAAKVIKGQPPGPTSYSSKFSNYLGSLFGNMPNWLNRIKDYLGIGKEGVGGAGGVGGSLGSGQFAAVGDLSKVSGDWKNDTEFLTAVNDVSRKYNIDANDLLGLIYHESAGTFDPTVKGKGSARGLFQFTRGGGFNPDHIVTLSRAEQVRLADEKIFAASGLPRGANAGQIYAAVFLPGIARRQGWQGIIARKGVSVPGVGDVYGANPSLDYDKDGVIDHTDLAYVISGKRLRMGLGTSPSLSSTAGPGGYVTRTGGTGAISGAYGTDRGTHTHEGLDISAPAGTPVASLADGVVTHVEFSPTYGNVVYVQQDDGLEARYSHLKGFAQGIVRDTRVSSGQILGYVGSTGRSTGNHLHFELRENGKDIDPTATYKRNKWIVGGVIAPGAEMIGRSPTALPPGYRSGVSTSNRISRPGVYTPNNTFIPNMAQSAADVPVYDYISKRQVEDYFRLRRR